MSYILDALRRADAERERGHVPGLHSQPAAGTETNSGPKARWWLWLAAALVLVVAGAGGGWWLSRPSTTVPAVVAEVAPRPAAPTPPLPSVAPPAPARVAPPAPRPTTAPTPAPQPVAASMPARVPPPSAVSAAAPAPPASSAVIAFERLPEDVRRQLPAVSIGGAIYSDHAASRMLIVSGQLLREGDAVAPGVTLEQIRPRSAVLRWKGLRYEVSF